MHKNIKIYKEKATKTTTIKPLLSISYSDESKYMCQANALPTRKIDGTEKIVLLSWFKRYPMASRSVPELVTPAGDKKPSWFCFFFCFFFERRTHLNLLDLFQDLPKQRCLKAKFWSQAENEASIACMIIDELSLKLRKLLPGLVSGWRDSNPS